jgi:hypothetical protein
VKKGHLAGPVLVPGGDPMRPCGCCVSPAVRAEVVELLAKALVADLRKRSVASATGVPPSGYEAS